MSLIFVQQKPMPGKEHSPEDGQTIGREGCDINLADPEVSRRHAAIRVDGEQLAIEDLGSTNGTFVNDRQIQGRQDLSEGDEVRLGNTVWKIQASSQRTAIVDSPAAAPPQVTAARQVPAEAAQPPEAPPAPRPPTPAPQPAAQAAPQPPAPPPPSPAAGAGARGDVPAPDFQPSAIRRVVPPPGGPAAFNPTGAVGRQRGSAATRLGATVLATIAVALTAAGVVAYYIAEPFEENTVEVEVSE